MIELGERGGSAQRADRLSRRRSGLQGFSWASAAKQQSAASAIARQQPSGNGQVTRGDVRIRPSRNERDPGSREAGERAGPRRTENVFRARRLRVVFFNRSYYPDYGATGQLLTELCEDLVSRFGFDVTVVAGMPLSGEQALRPVHWFWPVRREEHNGVRILRVWSTAHPTRKFTGRISNYLSYFSSAAIAALRIGRPDVIVSLTDPPIIALTASAAASVTGAKFVFLCEDVFPEVIRLLENFQNEKVEAILGRISRYIVRRADRIVALGDTMKRRLIETKHADAAKISVIHNWADTEAIRPGSKDNPFARAHGLVDKFVVMHSGNVGLSQDVDGLLDVAERLRDLPDVVVAIVGEGARKAFLQAEAVRRGLENVRFFPYQPKASLNESFATADIFIVSLKRGLEGFIVPSKLYGILAAGRPFIAAVEGDCEAAQIARDHNCGIVVEPGNRDQMVDAIRRLHAQPEERTRLSGNARDAGLTYDRRVAVEAYRQVFEELK
jgi:colanic acid biosynthesis glycosyl transferase WcaI